MKSAIIIFVRQPVLGKVKTRLAATIGNEKALKVYRFLLQHTFSLIKDAPVPVYVFYDEKITTIDLWNAKHIIKKQQRGADLGEKMANAFRQVIQEGNQEVVIIGSDCYELTTHLIEEALQSLKEKEVVIGPAKDGGYYLLGMRAPFKDLFQDINWSTETVLDKTMELIKQKNHSIHLLPVLRDVDTADDISFKYD